MKPVSVWVMITLLLNDTHHQKMYLHICTHIYTHCIQMDCLCRIPSVIQLLVLSVNIYTNGLRTFPSCDTALRIKLTVLHATVTFVSIIYDHGNRST